MIVLRSRPFRSVVLAAHGGETVVTKRFHHPHALRACFDRARARREFAALTAFARAGLPVPRALGVHAAEVGWELRLAAVEGARALRTLLDAREVPPGGWARLTERLGAGLARLQQSGWEHGDLHPGNVLVDARGQPWLIDLGAARRAPPEAARALAELVHGAAALREHLPARLRAPALRAWLGALPPELRPRLTGRALAHAVEQRARLVRRHQVRIGLGRWLRESSRVRRIEHGGARAWVRRELDDARVAALLAAPAAHGLVLCGTRGELTARWLGAARLHEHGLSVAQPALFVPGSHWRREAWAVFEPPAPERRAASRADLCAALAERGLALAAGSFVQDAAGVYLDPPREPEELLECDGEVNASAAEPDLTA